MSNKVTDHFNVVFKKIHDFVVHNELNDKVHEEMTERLGSADDRLASETDDLRGRLTNLEGQLEAVTTSTAGLEGRMESRLREEVGGLEKRTGEGMGRLEAGLVEAVEERAGGLTEAVKQELAGVRGEVGSLRDTVDSDRALLGQAGKRLEAVGEDLREMARRTVEDVAQR